MNDSLATAGRDHFYVTISILIWAHIHRGTWFASMIFCIRVTRVTWGIVSALIHTVTVLFVTLILYLRGSQMAHTSLSFTTFSLTLLSVSHLKPQRTIFSVRLLPLEIVTPAPLPHSSLLNLKSQYPLLQHQHCSSHQMLLPRCHR